MEELKNKIKNAYTSCNFFDSQKNIEDLKKKYDVKVLTKLIRAEYNICKKAQVSFEIEYNEIQEKYKIKNKTHLWREALSYITHRYKYGEWVLVKDLNELRTGRIIKINTSGYTIFTGRKIGTHLKVSESNVICHVANTKKMQEAFSTNGD